MRVHDLVNAMERIAPTQFAESWDNVGLLVGDLAAALSGPIVLTIDLTTGVVEEARGQGAGMILAYHPPIFQPIKRLTANDPKQRLILEAIAAGMAIYSPHTALDAADGGVADWLLDCALHEPDARKQHDDDRCALSTYCETDPDSTHKIVTFVPATHLDAVRSAMALAGAGRIGAYELCSYMLEGRGTFRGSAQSNPTVGEAGRFEVVEEIRLEMVAGAGHLAEVIGALRHAHPYEEPAFDVYRLEGKPRRELGAGRCASLHSPMSARALSSRIKGALGAPMVKLAAAGGDPEVRVTRVGVCPGAGASLVDAAIRAGCDAFLTGEMRHHEVLEANSRGCTILLAGHTVTERGYLPVLARRLGEMLPGINAVVSNADRWPFELVV